MVQSFLHIIFPTSSTKKQVNHLEHNDIFHAVSPRLLKKNDLFIFSEPFGTLQEQSVRSDNE